MHFDIAIGELTGTSAESDVATVVSLTQYFLRRSGSVCDVLRRWSGYVGLSSKVEPRAHLARCLVLLVRGVVHAERHVLGQVWALVEPAVAPRLPYVRGAPLAMAQPTRAATDLPCVFMSSYVGVSVGMSVFYSRRAEKNKLNIQDGDQVGTRTCDSRHLRGLPLIHLLRTRVYLVCVL